MRPSSSSPQWLCGDMPAMDGQWQSSRIVSVGTNRVLNKHWPRSMDILIKTEIGSVCLKESCFSDCWRSHLWSLYLRILGTGLQLVITALLVFFVVSKIFEKLRIIRLLINSGNVTFFFISSAVSGLLNQP